MVQTFPITLKDFEAAFKVTKIFFGSSFGMNSLFCADVTEFGGGLFAMGGINRTEKLFVLNYFGSMSKILNQIFFTGLGDINLGVLYPEEIQILRHQI